MSDTTNDAPGEVAEKRVRKTRVAKPRSPEQPEMRLSNDAAASPPPAAAPETAAAAPARQA